ncbi:MAG: glycosyltransferase [Candidatus Magasanikbacteria bacterium]|nr:glycosyltransferase [Candidatus Magasanikbacteria bacterium]
MKIGIDARMYGPKQAGLGRYIEQLILNLESIDTENQYVIFLRQENWDEFKPTSDNFKKVLADIPWYGWEEQIKLPKIIKQEKVDVMHFPHWNVPYFYKDPFVVTIHDLIMFHYPRAEATTLGPIKFWLKDKAHRILVKHVAKKAKHIIAVSEFTKQDVHNTLKVPASKITIIYEAMFSNQRSETGDLISVTAFGLSSSRREERELVLNKYGIDKPYVLYVGNAYPHKNLKGLLKAWKLFEQKYGSDYKLILVGKKNYFYKQEIKESRNQRIKNVVFTGFLSDEELVLLYKSASLYVFPSLYEGFGLPPLEAMAHGVPVASSNRSCLPEILGEAAIYFDPENYDNICDTIYKGLTDKDIRFDLANNANNEIKKYSWRKTAGDTLKIYKRSLKGR